ncbi:MAG: DUF2786 domain-containing protein [Ignisphaera sp.]|nr:DUF2786 domain-containing protein [Ignisphaera sp.]
MDMTAIKERVCKLLARSNSSNENEAALALAKAQQIILLHKLSIAECLAAGSFVAEEAIIRHGVPLVSAKKVALWQANICQHLSKHNDCRIFLCSGIGIVIYGRESDIRMVRIMLDYCIAQMWNIAPRGKGKIFSDSWYLGCINTIGRKLDEMKREALKAVTTYGLVKYEEQSKKVDTYIKKNVKVGTAKESSQTIDNRAYHQGRLDGERINVSQRGELS